MSSYSGCTGRCLTGADIGMPEYGSSFYAVDPDCSEHSTPMSPEEEEMIMPECEWCFGTEGVETTDGLTECKRCREYRQYYEALTPEEQRAEHAAEAAYVQETTERGDA